MRLAIVIVADVAKRVVVLGGRRFPAFLAVVGGWLVHRAGSDDDETIVHGAGAPARETPVVSSHADPKPAQAVEHEGPAPKGLRRIGRPARDRLLGMIRAARRRRAAKRRAGETAPAEGPASFAEGATSADPRVQKAYIRSRVGERVPLARECYDQFLERAPDTQGRGTAPFTIEGEPGVGGVGTSERDEATMTIHDPEFAACVQETRFAIEVDPPPAGGEVRVISPFEFRPG